MQSPLRAARARLGLSAAELALASGCRPADVSRAEAGGTIPQRVLGFLGDVGVDPEALRLEQETFRQQQAEALRSRAVSHLREVAT